MEACDLLLRGAAAAATKDLTSSYEDERRQLQNIMATSERKLQEALAKEYVTVQHACRRGITGDHRWPVRRFWGAYICFSHGCKFVGFSHLPALAPVCAGQPSSAVSPAH
jgi:hypothetical protein